MAKKREKFENHTPRPLTTGEVASYCHVTINAVKKWIYTNKIKAFLTPGGHYRIKPQDFKEFLKKYKMPLAEGIFPSISHHKILIVDDSPHIVEFIKSAVSSMGIGGTGGNKYEIETAGDGYEALIKVGDFKPNLLILDIRMPRIDGNEVCKRIRQNPKTRHIKILAVTAFGKEDAENIIKSGADGYLLKPLNLRELRDKVKEMI
ncbi:MAG: response regulator [Deltaproteobacteria bacterium]|nr:response regulator [Deltaproteobacteria bacterium]